MNEPDRITELLARMWIECDPNRGGADGADADETQPDETYSGGVNADGVPEPILATRSPLAGKPRWHWFIPRAEATIAYLAKHGLEIREMPGVSASPSTPETDADPRNPNVAA